MAKKELQSLATGLLLIQLLNGTTIRVFVQKAIALLCHFLPILGPMRVELSNILRIIFKVCTHMREGLQDTFPQNSTRELY